ncbi:hypothetical protein JB92DRAFT_2860751 [Gautieria morchelliformis]|nr:hypothetical protein JB92DRAFT_2860751 [Gautieria morchelliformis]
MIPEFHPSLGQFVPIEVDALSARTMGPRLRWKATLKRENYEKLCRKRGEVQVWSKWSSGEQWSAIPFKERATGDASVCDRERIDLSLFDAEIDSETSDDSVSLEASVALPPLVGRTVSVDFTYRVEYAQDGRVNWYGTPATNGKIEIHVPEDGSLKATSRRWAEEGNGTFLWTRKPVVLSKLSSDTKWSGWAVKQDSTGSFDIHRFVTSDSVPSSVVALALRPEANQDACAVYSPVLYTARNGTLSIEGDSVLLHRLGDGELPILNAYTLTSSWKDHVPDELALLDIQTSDFIGVGIKGQCNVGHLHFLPVTGSESVIPLNLFDVASLVPSESSVVLFDSNLHAIKFLSEVSPTESLRIAVGPVGGEVTVVPAYKLSGPISVAFLLHHPGSTAELVTNASVPHAESHTSIPRDIFSLAVQVVRYVLDLLLSSGLPKLSSICGTERIMHTKQSVQDPDTFPRLAFTVTGNSPLLVKAEDASKLIIHVGGKPLQTTPKDIGGGCWLVEDTGYIETDRAQRRIEVTLREDLPSITSP